MWTALAKLRLSSIDKVPVVFDNVQFFGTTPIPANGKPTIRNVFRSLNVRCFRSLGKLRFVVNILAGTGEFDVRESDSVVVSGFVNIQTIDERLALPALKSYEIDQLSTADVYQDLACKGYKYGNSFRGIRLTSDNGISSDRCP